MPPRRVAGFGGAPLRGVRGPQEAATRRRVRMARVAAGGRTVFPQMAVGLLAVCAAVCALSRKCAMIPP